MLVVLYQTLSLLNSARTSVIHLICSDCTFGKDTGAGLRRQIVFRLGEMVLLRYLLLGSPGPGIDSRIGDWILTVASFGLLGRKSSIEPSA